MIQFAESALVSHNRVNQSIQQNGSLYINHKMWFCVPVFWIWGSRHSTTMAECNCCFSFLFSWSCSGATFVQQHICSFPNLLLLFL